MTDDEAHGAVDKPAAMSRSGQIRSFVKRSGRITPGQKRALQAHWTRFGVEACAIPRLSALFESSHPVTLEIGFGSGDTLVHAAVNQPQHNYLGMEVYEPGIGRLLKAANDAGLTNLRVLHGDAVELLSLLPDRSLSAVWVFFPDPWPKKRHHKRRLVNHHFARCVERKLKGSGRLLLATDWEDYAHHMLATLDVADGLENSAGVGNFAARPIERVDTRFAKRGLRLGHAIWDLSYRQCSPGKPSL